MLWLLVLGARPGFRQAQAASIAPTGA